MKQNLQQLPGAFFMGVSPLIIKLKPVIGFKRQIIPTFALDLKKYYLPQTRKFVVARHTSGSVSFNPGIFFNPGPINPNC
jgi:hypothetical protein